MLLSPLFLLFGLTASVPLVLHLYRHRQRTVMAFSTSRFFTRAIIRAQRRLRLRRILLLMLRMAACLLIALAIAQPILRGIGVAASAGNRDLVIILDDSLSMQATDKARPSRFEQARRQAVDMLRELSGGDRAAVISFSGQALNSQLSDDPAGLAGQVAQLNPSFAAGDAAGAIRRAIDLLQGSRHRRRLVVVLSDLQASDWPGATWPQPHEPLDIVLDKVGDPPRENLALDSMSILPANLVVAQPASLSVKLVNHAAAAREVTLNVRVNDAEQSRRAIKLPPDADDVETIPLEFNSAGAQRIVASIDADDALAADNTLYTALNVQQQMPVLLIDGQAALTQGSAGQKRGSAAFYLRAAMIASGQSDASEAAIRPDVIAPAQLASQSLEGYRVVLVSAVNSMAQSDWKKVEDFARRGGGVAVFLDQGADRDFYDQALAPVKITGQALASQAGQALHVQRIEQDHPLFERFGGEARGAIMGLSIYRALPLDPGTAAVLASMDQQWPLAVEHELGQGKLMVWAVAPIPDATNLPLRRAFIPLVSQMISHLSGGQREQPPGITGVAMEVPVGKFASGTGLEVRRPDGSTISATTTMRGSMTVAQLGALQLARPGFYQLAKAGEAPQALCAVNVPRSESSTAPLQQTDIDRFAGMWNVTLTNPASDTAAAILSMRQGWSGWWDSLLWLTLGVVLIESLLAARQGSGGTPAWPMRAGLLALRGVAVACVVMGITHVRWQSRSSSNVRPALAVLLDDSKSMSQPLGQGLTRYDLASQIVKTKLSSLFDVVNFDARGTEMGQTPRPLAQQDASPLAASLAKIRQAMGDRPLAGIAMLSDGIDTDGADDSAVASIGTPVFPIEVAPAGQADPGPPDLSIDALSVNDRALVGNTVRAVVDLSARGKVDSQAVALSVMDGEQTLRSRLINWPQGASSQRAEIEFAPLRAGHITFAMQAGGFEGEKNLDNNRRFFSIDVRAKPITVLYIDGVLRWESKFLREALSNDPDLNLISSIRTLPGNAGGSRGLLLAEQLAKVDVVILGDVDAGFISAAEIDALRAWVSERGGGLLLSGGYHSFGPAGIGRTDLRQILPVEFSGAEKPQADQPFSLRLTEVGQDHAIFNFSSDRIRDTRFVQSLPRLDGCSRVAGVKPGAEVLAVNPTAAGPDGGALPVMICQQVGAGRSMVFAVDTTWRWRMVVGGFTGDSSFYQRFWGQIVRWLARGEAAKKGATLELSASQAWCEPAKSVEITARIRPGVEEAKTAPAMWRVSAVTLDSSGSLGTAAMSQTPDGAFRGVVTPRRPGRFDVIVTAQPLKVGDAGSANDDSSPLAQQQAITINVRRADIEMLNTTPDPMWLRRVAQRTGGRYLTPGEIETWAKELPHDPVQVDSIHRVELWRSPWLVAIFLSALCAEWIIRRKEN